MGVFDYYVSADQKVTAQLKVGPCVLHAYKVGDRAPIRDGFYHDYGAVVLIKNGKLENVYEDMTEVSASEMHWDHFTKWGDPCQADVDLDQFNQTLQAVKEISRKYS